MTMPIHSTAASDIRRFLVSLASVFVLLCSWVSEAEVNVAYAQANAAPSMGGAIGAMVANQAAWLGFSVSGAQVAATLSAISSEAGALASRAAVAAGVAVASVTMVEIASAAGMVLVPTTLGVDTLPQWQFNANGTVTVTPGNPGTGPSSYPPLGPGVSFYTSSDSGCSGYCAGSVYGVAEAYVSVLNSKKGATVYGVGSCTSAVPYSCTITASTSGGPTFVNSTMNIYAGQNAYSGQSCSTGLIGSGSCVADVPPPLPPQTPLTGPPSSAGAGTSAADQASPLNPVVAAAVANALWADAAAQPGYEGLPYSPTAAITAAQASAAQVSLGGSWPTVGSFVGSAGAVVGGTGSNAVTVPDTPASSAAANPASSSSTSSSSSETQDLCAANPSILACADLGTASAGSLPASTVNVSLSPVSVGGPANPVCPAPMEVSVFGSQVQFAFDPVCQFATDVNPIVLVACSFAAALIVAGGLRS
jgi:hypothetical protein